MIRLERNDARMVLRICNVRPEERVSAELRISMKLNSMREYLQDRRLQWFTI